MAEKQNPFPNQFVPVGPPEKIQVTAAQVEQARRDIATMDGLDRITQPVEAKVYGSTVWTYRNKAYREFVNKMDEVARNELYKITKQKTKK